MYKVFISSRPIYFCTKANSAQLPKGVERVKKKKLFPTGAFLKSFDAGSHPNGCWIKVGRNERTWEKFCNSLDEIPAAGGAVQGEDGKLLFIFRRGHWDMPKGKVDPGETIKQAAVREVMEECGIAGVYIKAPLLTTYHGYKHKGKWALKPSHWFLMGYDGTSQTLPQAEEDIEEATWLSQDEFESKTPVFANIVDVAAKAFTCP